MPGERRIDVAELAESGGERFHSAGPFPHLAKCPVVPFLYLFMFEMKRVSIKSLDFSSDMFSHQYHGIHVPRLVARNRLR